MPLCESLRDLKHHDADWFSGRLGNKERRLFQDRTSFSGMPESGSQLWRWGAVLPILATFSILVGAPSAVFLPLILISVLPVVVDGRRVPEFSGHIWYVVVMIADVATMVFIGSIILRDSAPIRSLIYILAAVSASAILVPAVVGFAYLYYRPTLKDTEKSQKDVSPTD